MNPRIYRDINTVKPDKGLIERTRNYIDPADQNRAWEDENMSKHIIPSVTISKINAIDASRKELINLQKESSQTMHKITIEYNDLLRKYDKRDKQLKRMQLLKINSKN